MKVIRKDNQEVVSVWKYIIDTANGEESIWSNEWPGRHVIGIHCEWEEFSEYGKHIMAQVNSIPSTEPEAEAMITDQMGEYRKVDGKIKPKKNGHYICHDSKENQVRSIEWSNGWYHNESVSWWLEPISNPKPVQPKQPDNTTVGMSEELQDSINQYYKEKPEYFDQDNERYSTPISDRFACLVDRVIVLFEHELTSTNQQTEGEIKK